MPVRALNDFVDITEAKVEVSTDGGTTWVAHESFSVSIGGGDLTRPVSKRPDLSGQEDTITGVLSASDITMRVIITNGSDELYWVARTAARNDTDFDVRYSALAAASGDLQFTTSGGKVSSCPTPTYDATSADGRGEVDIVVSVSDVAEAMIP